MNVKRQEIACEAFREGAVKDLLHPESRMDSGMWRGEGFWGQVQYGRGDGQIENRLCDEYLVGSFSIAYWIHLDILVSGSQNITGMLR